MTSDNLLLKSVKRRQKDGPRELAELLNKEDAAQKKREELNAFHSRAWNLRKKQMREAKKPEAAEDEEQQALPEGWRDLHWKTLVKLADEVLGTEHANKRDAMDALEAYENGRN